MAKKTKNPVDSFKAKFGKAAGIPVKGAKPAPKAKGEY